MSNRLKLLREKATRPRRTVPVLLDGEVREQIEAVEDELDRLDSDQDGEDNDRRLGSKAKITAAARKKLVEDLDHLYGAAAESTLYLVLEAMQRTPYRALVAAHPPRTDGDGKPLAMDRLAGGVNAETFVLPLARASIVGYRERPEADAPVLPLDPTTVDEDGNVQPGMVDFLLGYSYERDGEKVEVDGFATPRQISMLGAVASELCVGDDAVPLRRQRSATGVSAAG